MSIAGSGTGSARVAVIAVHGVGDQGPNETAREVARLLQRANGDAYSAFAEGTIDLPVGRGPSTERPSSAARSGSPWYVRSPHVRKMAGPEETGAVDIEFTASAIEKAEPDGKTSRYASIRLTGERERADGAVTLDVYELYWADLSRLSGVLAQVLGKFYQLLFHFASLGQKTVELAWLSGQEATGFPKRALTVVTFLQTIVEALIGVVMPVMNLCFAAVVLPVMLLLASDTVRLVACALAVAALAGTGVYLALFKGGARPLKVWAPLLPLAAGALAGGVVGRMLWTKGGAAVTLYVLALLGLLLVVWLLSSMLGERRSETKVASVLNSLPKALAVVGIAFGAWLSWEGWRRCGDAATVDERIAQAIAFAADGVFYVLQVSFALLILSGIFLTIGYLAVAASVHGKAGGAAVRRALWTGQIGFFIPTTLFLIVTVIIWKALLQLVARSIPPDTPYSPWLHEVLPGWLVWFVPDLPTRLHLPKSFWLVDYARELSTEASGAFFNVLFLMIAAAGVLLVLGVLPSIIAETSPPKKSTADRSRRLGVWLDDGFAGAKLAGWLVLLALVVVLPLGARPQVIEAVREWDWEFLIGDSVANWIGGLIAGSVAVLAAFRRNIFGGAQKALDIALDVDNWLRERPPHRNPRGLILLRFIALLRAVQDRGYDRIVIVSHSQGAVVSADLLRYLNAEKDGANWTRHGLAALQDVPIRLLTFGAPLRQLYGRRFPHLYGWACDLDKRDPELRRPNPEELGVRVWVNGYRSGDYVGRYLWQLDDSANRYTPTDLDASLEKLRHAPADGKPRAEFCLGEGAHTHYFDETATPVGRLIDTLILAR